jgi:hypothetical protein
MRTFVPLRTSHLLAFTFLIASLQVVPALVAALRRMPSDAHPEDRRPGPQRRPVSLDWDAKAGKLYLEIPETGKDFLLLDQLPYGLGSNDVGLDRGQLGRGPSRPFHTRRQQGPADRAQSRYRSSAPTRPSASRSRSPSPSRCYGDSRSKPRRMAACSSTPPTSSCATRMDVAERLQASGQGNLQARSEPQRDHARQHQELPQEHRSRSDPHLRLRWSRRRANT